MDQIAKYSCKNKEHNDKFKDVFGCKNACIACQLEETGYQLSLVKETIWERLGQHKNNLELWQNGFLGPTEPDSEEREIIKRELKAAITELEYLKKACSL